MAAPVITSSLTASGTQGVAFSYQITASGAPTSYSATGLPSGLSLNTSTGAITGSSTVGGTYSVTIRATNADGTGFATLVITLAFPESVIYRACSSIKDYIESLNLPVTVQITNTPQDLAIDLARPWVMVCPLVDALTDASNVSFDVTYQVVVAIIGNRGAQTLDTMTRWREVLRNTLHHSARRISGMPDEVTDITVEPRSIIEQFAWQQQQTIASALILRVEAQEAWG